MNRQKPDAPNKAPVARSSEALLDDPGNEDPGSQLDAPVPLYPSTKARREKSTRQHAPKAR
ncbi:MULTISPECIES: hypothetical protein [Pseudomonas]|jgi:hypothetical protein|uniref:hypothetical protein n=1 Tax=Pseudomonas TaxID=286 RepID=UPI00137A0006|nr:MULTISPECIES: hypothetical protein [Pseudomonas]